MMKNVLDLSYVDAADLLRATGIKNISVSGNEISFSCFGDSHFHGDRNPSARMNARTTQWLCNGCRMRGNAITFLSQYKHISETYAKRLLEERYGAETDEPVEDLSDEVLDIMAIDFIEQKEKRKPPAESWLHIFKVDWVNEIACPSDYLENTRGFNSDTLNEWEIGYDKISDRITIPIRDETGFLVGFKGRSYNGKEPRYMVLPAHSLEDKYGFQSHKKSEYVFGLDRYIDNYTFGENAHVIIVEGEFNVIALYQKGFKFPVGISGSDFSDIQRDIIKKYCSEATIYFDDDEAGRNGTKKVVEMLSPYLPIRVVQNAPGDAAELDKESIRELLVAAEPALLLQARGEL